MNGTLRVLLPCAAVAVASSISRAALAEAPVAESDSAREAARSGGAKVGVAAGGELALPIGGATPFGGGRGDLLLNYAVSTWIDLRMSAFGTGATGNYGARAGSGGANIGVVLRPNQRLLLGLAVEGGYFATTEIRKWHPDGLGFDVVNQSGGFVGPAAYLGVALGASRQWEIGVKQGGSLLLASAPGSPRILLSTSLGLTYLFFDSISEPKAVARR